MFHLDNASKWPIYDIEAIIYDYNNIIKKSVIKPNSPIPYLKKADFDASVMYAYVESQVFQGSNVISLKLFNLPDGLLFIQLKSRSSFVYQKMAFVRDGSMIYDGNGKVLQEDFRPNTPDSIKEKIRAKFKLIPDKINFNFIF